MSATQGPTAGAESGPVSGPGETAGREPTLGRDVCPAEHAGWLTTPFRRLITDPKRILRGLVAPGDTALDLGCGPGYFTVPLARMVGDDGRVIAVDVQQAMLDRLRTRADRAGVAARITLHRCPAGTLGLNGTRADFALAFWMVHEVPDEARFYLEVHDLLRDGGRVLVVEPAGHVPEERFTRSLDAAHAAGFTTLGRPRVAFSRAALLGRAARRE